MPTTLTDVLTSSIAAVADLGSDGSTILVRQGLDIENRITGHWYDIQRPGSREHNFVYVEDLYSSSITTLVDELADLGIDVDSLNWQASNRHIDLFLCPCAECEQFRVENGLLPLSATRAQKIWHAVLSFWSSLEWQLYLLSVRFRMWRMRWYR